MTNLKGLYDVHEGTETTERVFYEEVGELVTPGNLVRIGNL